MSDVNYLVDPNTGEKFRVGGCKVGGQPPDAPKFGAMRTLSSKQLPPLVDLRQLMTPVEQQLDTNACAANALAGAYEFLIMKNSRKHVDVSRLFIYYNSRLIDGQHPHTMRDEGTYISSGIKGLTQYGCCKEDIYPYRIDLINRQPPQYCYDQAKNYRIVQSMTIDTNLDEMKACLAEGYPFAFGLQLFQSFMNAGSNYGRIPMPQYYEQQSAQHGWHAMLAVGYSDSSQCFIVRNSWGERWGDKGYCYIPYAYMTNRQRCLDLQAIKLVTGESRPQPDRNVHNPYSWNTNKNDKNIAPSDYPYPDFHYKFFWQLNDMFNYFKNIYQNGQVVPFVWKLGDGENEVKEEKINSTSRKLILWIDTKNDGNTFVANKLSSDKSVQLELFPSMQKAQDYILSNNDSLRSLPNFVIISRGFYKDENKNPLNLLDFLLTKRIRNAQVFVFTQDKKGVEYHLGKQAASFHLPDWKERLIIFEDVDQLIENIKQSFNKIK